MADANALAHLLARLPGWLVPILGVAPLLLVCGWVVGGARLDAVATSPLRAMVGRRVDCTAELLTLPSVKSDALELDVKVLSVAGRGLTDKARVTLEVSPGDAVPASDPCGALTEGAVVRLDGALVEALPPPKPGEFDYGRFLERRGEHVVLAAPLTSMTLAGHRHGLAGLIDRLRLAARRHLRFGMRAPTREVLEGMVLGDAKGVDDGTVEDFRRSGLLHILAVSGENVVLLCSIAGLGLRLCGLPRRVRDLVLLPAVVVYVIVTGATASIVRAGVAGVVALLADLASRPGDGWLFWLLPAAWIMTRNPNALYDVSFQLSFAAVAGLLLLSRPLTRALAFLPGAVAENAGVTTAASIATAPVSLAAFGQASLVAVPANVAGGFVLGPIMLFGMVGVLVGFVSPWLSLPLNVLAGLFTGFLLTVSAWFSGLSFAVYEWHGLTLAVCLVVAAGAFLGGMHLLARRAGTGVLAYAGGRGRRGRVIVAAATLLAVALVLAPPPPAAPRLPTLTILSVGEGAAALLQVPGGPTVLIDAGPRPLGDALRAHGVRHIDLLVLSHGHADHTAGLADVLGRVPVAEALVPQPAAPSESLSRVEAELAAAHVPVRALTTPLTLQSHGVGLTVVPTGGSGMGDNQGENDCALVAEVTLDGRTTLLPGDAEAEALAPLGLPPCAVVELPHHGSAGGYDDALLDELEPSLAVVSVGENRFGHPTAAMLDLMARRGLPLLRTDEVGDVTLTAGPDGLELGVAHPPPAARDAILGP